MVSHSTFIYSNNSKSIVPVLTQDIILIIIGIASAVLILLFIFIFIFCRRKSDAPSPEHNKKSYQKNVGIINNPPGEWESKFYEVKSLNSFFSFSRPLDRNGVEKFR
jgi:hypothetical protein